jgi:cell division protein FtsB
MAKAYRNSAEILAERALQPDEPRADRAGARRRASVVPPPEPARRMIYSGTMPVPPELDTPTGAHLPPKNRTVTRWRVSPFNIIVALMVTAAAIVFYISNIIAVNQLANDIHKQELVLQDLLNEQEVLRAKTSQMSSLERIRKRAEEELGLQNPTQAPAELQLDAEKVREVQEAMQKH